MNALDHSRWALLCVLACAIGCGQAPASETTSASQQRLAAWSDPHDLTPDQLELVPTACSFALAGAQGFVACATPGVIYSWKRMGSTWVEQQQLAVVNRGVVLSGSTMLLERGGGLLVYDYIDEAWQQTGDIDLGSAYSFAGMGFALEGNTALFGDVSAGVVHVLERSGSTWSETQALAGPEQYFGAQVALSGDNAIVASGPALYFYRREGGAWNVAKKLERDSGGPLFQFLRGGKLSGDTALISGAEIQVYERSDAGWELQASLGQFGAESYAMALQGDTVLLGDPEWEQGVGRAIMMTRTGSLWSAPQFLPAQHANFGRATALWEGGAAVTSTYTGVEPGYGYYGPVHLMVYDRFDEPSTCQNDGDCGTGHCVEGVCCNTACEGSCQSCLASRKGSGLDGFCGQVPDDTCLPDVTEGAAGAAGGAGVAEGGASAAGDGALGGSGQPGSAGEPSREEDDEPSGAGGGPRPVASRSHDSGCQSAAGTQSGLAALLSALALGSLLLKQRRSAGQARRSSRRPPSRAQ